MCMYIFKSEISKKSKDMSIYIIIYIYINIYMHMSELLEFIPIYNFIDKHSIYISKKLVYGGTVSKYRMKIS